MRFIHYARSIDREKQNGAKENGTVVVKSNVLLIEECNENLGRDCYDVSRIWMILRNIGNGETLFVNYGELTLSPSPNGCVSPRLFLASVAS